MNQPQGLGKATKNGGELVCKRKNALNGICEAPRAWNALFNKWLLSISF